MKISFHLHNSPYGEKDYSQIEKGNPGIGGTEFMIIWVATVLSRRSNNIDVILFCDYPSTFASSLEVFVSPSVEDGYYKADSLRCDYFIFDFRRGLPLTQIQNIASFHTKLIPWAHTFDVQYTYEAYCRNPKLARILTVSREQQDLYIDHSSYDKTDYIFNCFVCDPNLRLSAFEFPIKNRNHIVTFIGSLTENKNFHVLAELWPGILEKVPDAELYIVGSGTLYNQNAEMGEYGISTRAYEPRFMKYLINENHQILPSVHFVGNLGKEKFDILAKTKVGVPNPIGKGETFGICAIEMQAMGCQVVAMKAPGYLDTFYNGKLVNSKKELGDTIVKCLLSEETKSKKEVDAFLAQFEPEFIAQEWEIFLKGDMQQPLHPRCPYPNLKYRLKWMKILLRSIKKFVPFTNRSLEAIFMWFSPNHQLPL